MVKKYALIGQNINYSYSKLIHDYLINHYNLAATYELVNVNELDEALLTQYDGCNITIPFKETVLAYAQARSGLGMINTIVKKNDKLHGYNTDLEGFVYLLNNSKLHKMLKELKTIVILGNGATSKMIQAYFKDKMIKVVSRTQTAYNYAMLDTLKADLLINTTPVGMNEDKSLVADHQLYQFKAVIDLNYNPLNSKLKRQANEAKIPFVNGLDMLLVQALKAFELWHGINAMGLLETIKKEVLLQSQKKLALIGFSLSGKTTLIKRYHGVDLDELIALEYGPIATLLKQRRFRERESQVLKEVVVKDTKLLACGGGIVLDANNMQLLRDYLIIYVKESKSVIKQRLARNERPLLKNKEDFNKMYYQRRKLYERYANITLNYEESEAFINEFCHRNKD